MRNADWSKYLDQMERSLQVPEEEKRPAPAAPITRLEPVIPVAPPRPYKPIETVTPLPETARPVPAPAPAVPAQQKVESMKPSEAETVTVQKAVRLRKRIPDQLNAPARDEVARNSYKGFKETREELLQRLLDPQISLEDAARILNVCPTTVRRYTNRGVLKHIRTAGNQRRFHLSDVLAFMEAQARGEIEE